MTDLTQPRDTTRTYQRIARNLAARIASGDFKPGERLPSERDLAASLNVSRTSLREALLALEIAQLVEIRVGSGVFVREAPSVGLSFESMLVSEPGPFEIIEMRRVIEGESAFRAALKGDEHQIAAIQEVIDAVTDSVIATFETFDVWDRLFHIRIAEATHNSLFVQMIGSLWDMKNNPMWDTWYHGSRDIENRVRSAQDHREIFAFIQNHHPDHARTAMMAHTDRLIQRFMRF